MSRTQKREICSILDKFSDCGVNSKFHLSSVESQLNLVCLEKQNCQVTFSEVCTRWFYSSGMRSSGGMCGSHSYPEDKVVLNKSKRVSAMYEVVGVH